MSGMKKFWIILEQWSLMDSMATESISPYSFYGCRSFGSDLSRIGGGSERVNNIILYGVEPIADYAVELSEECLDKESLVRISKKQDIYAYPRTICYQKGRVRFRFNSEHLMKSFLAQAEIMLEVKCVDLYRNDFYVSSDGIVVPQDCAADMLALDSQSESILRDGRNNSIKGAVLGYARGLSVSRSAGDSALLASLTGLRNAIGGIHTAIMLDDTFIPGREILSMIDSAEGLYDSSAHGATIAFTMVRHLYSELSSLASMRSKELADRKAHGVSAVMASLDRREHALEKEISDLEFSTGLAGMRDELDAIRRREVEMGRANGKTRKYFPKGSLEYDRKKYLKDEIARCESEDSRLATLYRELSSVKEKKNSLSTESTEYDNAISPVVIRISDILSELIDKVSKTSSGREFCFDAFVMEGGFLQLTGESGFSEAEVEYFNILLRDVQEHPMTELRPVSDVDVMAILERTGKKYVSCSRTFKTEGGRRVREILSSLWRYKRHDPEGRIILPDDLPLLKGTLPFFVKYIDFAQIEKFSSNKSVEHCEFALLIWSAMVGFASLPRTMTSVLYSDVTRYMGVQDKIVGLLGL